MKKNLIYLLIFLFFNCIFINSLKADINHEDAEATNAEFSLSYGITFDDDGDKMYIVGTDPGFKNIVVQYDLTTPYDVSTKSFEKQIRDTDDGEATTTVITDLAFSAGGGGRRIHGK